MKPYYEHAGITIYHGDCREILSSLPPDASIITDPPYGMDWNTDSTRFSGGESKLRRGEGRSDYGGVKGDAEDFDPEPWLRFPKVVMWGSNHYGQRLPVGTTLVWVKKQSHLWGTFLSDAEVAWMKGGHGVYLFEKSWNPPARAIDAGGDVARPKGIHPTQKPIALMAWCMDRAKVTAAEIIVDPYLGSGPTLRAAKNRGCRAIGIELEEHYCEIAAKRLEQEVLSL